MSLISTRCLFVLVLILLPFPTRSDGIDGFPKLDDNKTVKAAVEKIALEDYIPGTHELIVDGVMDCFAENAMCPEGDVIKNEVRLRNGYKTLGEGYSADPALNRHLFSPPSHRDLVKYPIWQRHLLDANQPLCSPFKHLQCSKTTAKCECRPGLIWTEESFKIHFTSFSIRRFDISISRGLRDREKICIFAMNKPCQMREYPGDEEVDSKALRPEQIKDGIPLASYFSIFHRELGGDVPLGSVGLAIGPPSCGDNLCSRSLYTQRQRVCAPRDYDEDLIFEGDFPPNQDVSLMRVVGGGCDYDYHRPLYTISDEELSDSDFWAKRKKTLKEVPSPPFIISFGHRGFCDLTKLSKCSPLNDPNLPEHAYNGVCECIPPSIPTMPIQPPPSQFIPLRIHPSCVFPEEFKKCDMTNGIIRILHNKTYTRGTKLLLNKGVEISMVGVCPKNFKCHTGLDINEEMEIYCTCRFRGRAGPQCRDKLTDFLMFPRVPSFPSDGKDIEEKWKIFNEFNEKAVQFEKIFKLSEGNSCDLNAEADASAAVERIRRLDKKGTVMKKAQYEKLTDTIVKLTSKHKNGQGLCQRFGVALVCNSVDRTCVKEDENILLEACKHLADNCELEGMFIDNGICYCDPKPEPSTTPDPRDNSTTSDKSTKSLGVVKTPHHYFHYFIVLGIILIVMN